MMSFSGLEKDFKNWKIKDIRNLNHPNFSKDSVFKRLMMSITGLENDKKMKYEIYKKSF